MSPEANKQLCKRHRQDAKLLKYSRRFHEKYILHQFWIDSIMSKKIAEISDVPDVDIAEVGCFKYILVQVRNRSATHEQSKFVVRGNASSAYHGKWKIELKKKETIPIIDFI